MKFNCSLSTQQFLDSTPRLMGARNKSLLARAAITAALSEGVPASFWITDAQGVDLDENIMTRVGETLSRACGSIYLLASGRTCVLFQAIVDTWI